jgi:hypothetical protein
MKKKWTEKKQTDKNKLTKKKILFMVMRRKNGKKNHLFTFTT